MLTGGPPRHRRLSAALMLCLVATLAVGCGGEPAADEAPRADTTTTSTATPTATTSASDLGIGIPDDSVVEGLPAGVELTAAGTEQTLGEDAVVAWRPRQLLLAVAELRVRRVDQVDVDTFEGFALDDEQQRATPFLARTRVTNLAPGDLSRRVVPLYALDDEGGLVEPTGVPQDFAPCPRPALPGPFGVDQRTTTCQVFLLPEGRTLSGLAFLPLQGGDPVNWRVEATAS